MKVFVAGSAGFIGTNFVRILLRERPDWDVLSFDALTYAGNPENLEELSGNARHRFVQGDITDAAVLDRVVADFVPDAIVNFAAETHVDRSIHGFADVFVRTNVIGVQNLLEVVRKRNISRFVQVSTDEVFGALDLNDGKIFTEDTAFAPNSPYAASKASGDLLCRAYFKTYGVPVMVTHCGNNYGPYHFPEKIIPFFITRAMNDQPLPLYGDGLHVRDWVHVEDHGHAILAVLEKGEVGRSYNVSADNERSNIDLAKMMLRLLGKDESMITFVAERPGHDRRYAIQPSEALLALGWSPKYDAAHFEQGLRETIEWFQSHADWAQRAIARANGVNQHIE